MAEIMKMVKRFFTFLKSAYHGALLALIAFQLSFLPNQIMAQTTGLPSISQNNQEFQESINEISAQNQSPTEATTSAEANAKIKAQSNVTKATITTDLEDQRKACTGAHQKWDDELNSCMTTNDAIEMREDYQSCADSEDPQACYLSNAEEKSGVKSGDSYEKKSMENVAMIVAGAYSIFMAIAMLSARAVARRGAGRSDPTGNCTSKYIFWGTSLAWIAGDMYLKHLAKKKFKEIAERYEKEANNEEIKGDSGNYAAQVRAFHYLKEEQEQIKDQAKKRKMLQVAVVAGFGASAGFAAYETFVPSGQLKACKTPDENTPEPEAETPAPEVSETVAEDAIAGGADPQGVALPSGPNSPSFFANQIVKTGSSPQILVGAGVMLALTAYLAFMADTEASRAKENIAEIEEVLATYSEYMSGFCPDGREDLNNARCYCYTSEGDKNEARTNSVICQNLYAADELNYSLRNEKLADTTTGPRQGCITVTGQFDIDCKCREMKNTTTKQNACAKTPNSALISGSFGTQLGAPNTLKSLNSISNGANKGIASLNPAALNSQAAKNKKILDSILKQSAKNGQKVPSLGGLEKRAIKMMNAAGKNVLSRDPGYRGIRRGNEGPRPPSLSKAIEKAEKKVNLSNPKLAASIGTGKIGVGSPNKGFKFDWNDNAAREGNKVQTFMNKKYDYKDSDIVQRDDVSLWNVISKRYQTSGLKRLFGEDGDDD
jgi:hypothetical protein